MGVLGEEAGLICHWGGEKKKVSREGSHGEKGLLVQRGAVRRRGACLSMP